jgi:drug/metabolite transporter (DMT)-like permease
MNNILFAIFFSGLLYIVFKSFNKFSINTFQAILINYSVAFILGLCINESNFQLVEIFKKPWFLFSLVLGFLFIVVFYIIAKTTQINGLTVASVASKMSMIIPIMYGIMVFKEKTSVLHIIGILIALSAVYYVSLKANTTIHFSHFQLPILLFLGAGTIDTLINITQHQYLVREETALFSSITFFTAFSFGLLYFIYLRTKTKISISIRDSIGGIALGIPNYFSLFFLTKALQTEHLESPTIFTIINIGVILFTTLVGIILFREKLSPKNYFGIALAILALFLVTQ